MSEISRVLTTTDASDPSPARALAMLNAELSGDADEFSGELTDDAVAMKKILMTAFGVQTTQYKKGMLGKVFEIRRLTLSGDKKMLLVNDQNMTKVLETYSLDNNGTSLDKTTNLPRAKDGSVVEKCDGMAASVMVGPQTDLAKEVAESMGTVPDPNPSFVSLVLKDDAVVTFRFESEHGMSGDGLAKCFVAYLAQKYDLSTSDELADGEQKEEAGDDIGVSAGDIALTESAAPWAASSSPDGLELAVPKERVAQLTEML